MIIQARQSFRIEQGDEVLEMKNMDIATVDDRWAEHPFLQGLLKGGKVIYYIDNKDKTVETANKKAKDKAVEQEEANELKRLIDQAKETARLEAEQIAQTQGLDEKHKKALIETKTAEAIKKVQEELKSKK